MRSLLLIHHRQYHFFVTQFFIIFGSDVVPVVYSWNFLKFQFFPVIYIIINIKLVISKKIVIFWLFTIPYCSQPTMFWRGVPSKNAVINSLRCVEYVPVRMCFAINFLDKLLRNAKRKNGHQTITVLFCRWFILLGVLSKNAVNNSPYCVEYVLLVRMYFAINFIDKLFQCVKCKMGVKRSPFLFGSKLV